MTVAVALLLPVMLLMVALIINIYQLVFTKIKLQNTVDACALSAAAVQAAGLNEIADLNSEMVKEFNTLSQILQSGIWESDGEAKNTCDFFYNGGGGVIDYIRRYQKQSNIDYALQADMVARQVKDLNLPQSDLIARKTGPLTDLTEVQKTIQFIYYNASAKSPPVPTLRWQKPGIPQFADSRHGEYTIPENRTMPTPGSFTMPERVIKTSPTYVDYEISVPVSGFLLAGEIFGTFPDLKARAAAKPAGGHVYKGNPDYTAVLFK